MAAGPGAVRRRRQTGYQAASGLDRFRRPRDEWDGLAIKGRLLQETLCARGGKAWERCAVVQRNAGKRRADVGS